MAPPMFIAEKIQAIVMAYKKNQLVLLVAENSGTLHNFGRLHFGTLGALR